MGLRWVRVVKRAIKNFKEELKNMYDILEIVDLTGRPKAINILVTGIFFIYRNKTRNNKFEWSIFYQKKVFLSKD